MRLSRTWQVPVGFVVCVLVLQSNLVAQSVLDQAVNVVTAPFQEPARVVAGAVNQAAAETKTQLQNAGIPGAVADVALGPVTGPVNAANDLAHGRPPTLSDAVIKPNPGLNAAVKTIGAVAATKAKVDGALDSVKSTAQSADAAAQEARKTAETAGQVVETVGTGTHGLLEQARRTIEGTSGLIVAATVLLWALIALVVTMIGARLCAMLSRPKRQEPTNRGRRSKARHFIKHALRHAV